MKPILLLDVDGVLNVPRPRRTLRPICLKSDGDYKPQFFPNRRTSRFMRMAWDLFDVRWLTAWGSGANLIARHYGLAERPAIRDLGGESWKAMGAASALLDYRGRVAWIEDGIDDVAMALVERCGWTYLHCEPYVGVTGEHMKRLREFAMSSRIATDREGR